MMEASKNSFESVPVVEAGTPIREIARVMLDSGSLLVGVRDWSGDTRRMVDVFSVLKWVAEDGESFLTAGDVARELPDEVYQRGESSVVEMARRVAECPEYFPLLAGVDGDKGLGLLSIKKLLSEMVGEHEVRQERIERLERLYNQIFADVPLGIALFDEKGEIAYANESAGSIIGQFSEKKGKEFRLCEIDSPAVISLGDRHYRLQTVERDFGVDGDPTRKSCLAIITDVTAEHDLIESVKKAKEEAEMALNITLPDIRIVERLRSIPEYRDESYDETGRVRVTERIPGGTYLHVINILRLIAETFTQGLMDLPGMDKDTAVSFAIFHDIAKVQPELEIGAIIDPKAVFEPGYLHAERGADLAQKFYGLGQDAVELIRYHHHVEKELPGEFPRALLPMHRFVRLLDGLSAGITRRNARVSIMVDGSKLIITEANNPVPCYNRRFIFDLYTGSYREL